MSILRLFRKHEPAPPKNNSALGRCEIILSGSGGQGAILAGKILAEAAAIYDGREAVMAQSYGPEARGGASRAEVIISTDAIDYPKVISADVLLAMTQEAMNAYGKMLEKDGLLIVDEILVKDVPPSFKNVFKAPFTGLATKLLEASITVNIIALGALVAITNVVSREALIRTCIDHVPQKFLALDRMAVDVGFKAVRDSGFKWERRGS